MNQRKNDHSFPYRCFVISNSLFKYFIFKLCKQVHEILYTQCRMQSVFLHLYLIFFSRKITLVSVFNWITPVFAEMSQQGAVVKKLQFFPQMLYI